MIYSMDKFAHQLLEVHSIILKYAYELRWVVHEKKATFIWNKEKNKKVRYARCIQNTIFFLFKLNIQFSFILHRFLQNLTIILVAFFSLYNNRDNEQKIFPSNWETMKNALKLKPFLNVFSIPSFFFSVDFVFLFVCGCFESICIRESVKECLLNFHL